MNNIQMDGRRARSPRASRTLPDPDHKEEGKNKEGKKRFPLPVEIDENALSKEHQITYVAQDNQYDIDFLLSRARRIGYVVFVKEEEREKDRITKREAALFRAFRRQSSQPAPANIRIKVGHLAH